MSKADNGELKAKPFLRWAGSKKQLLHILESYWDGQSRYLEPFCGSASLFFHLEPDEAYLNDANKEVINAFRCVKKHPKELYSIYSDWKCDEETYKSIREQDENLDSLQRAARFIYLMRQCYGGVYRTNKQGHFNVPYGKKSTGRMPAEQDLEAASLVLSKASISNQDYSRFLKKHISKGDFVYLDPPYSKSRLDYSTIACEEKKLLEILILVDNSCANFVLSCSNEFYIHEAKKYNWDVVEVEVRRSIASNPSDRKKVKEYIVSNCERGS